MHEYVYCLQRTKLIFFNQQGFNYFYLFTRRLNQAKIEANVGGIDTHNNPMTPLNEYDVLYASLNPSTLSKTHDEDDNTESLLDVIQYLELAAKAKAQKSSTKV